ncbi:beta-lactamase [Tamlana nanhaiensis]|uniref:Beta-lactamase n=1 Tax=Neotamlana nanhaiensis TaxID=1382798 RepID=A0A0D7W1K7_9FLAO|nr:MBL fold metallo-hydrolase [Tamlana nanhaiensis]KJD32966.1 beta-lactamase [Tamlana nanhaiensis]
MKAKITLILLTALFLSCKQSKKTPLISEVRTETPVTPELKITPIEHASTVIVYGDTSIFLDPTGDALKYQSFKSPDFIVITDIHGDHLSLETLKALDLSETTIIAPLAVAEKLPKGLQVKTINNGEIQDFETFKIEAIPMYNLREEALKFHSKGRGNGYVFTFGDERVYFSGDTEDIPEMRALKNIDKAFVCMNLPYTMTVESAASAVLEFKPKEVFPYHFRGSNGFSDVEKFKTIVTEDNTNIKVTILDWYPKP